MNRTARRPRLPSLGLPHRIILLVVLSAVVAASVVSAITISRSRDALRRQILTDQQTAADLAAGMALRYAEAVQISLKQLGTSREMQEAIATGDFTAIQPRLQAVHEALGRVESIFVVDLEGNSLVRTGGAGSTASSTDRDWFQVALATKQPYFGEPVLGRASGKPVSVYAVPLLDGSGNVTVIIGGSVSLGALSTALNRLDLGSDTTTITLVDRRAGGIVLSSPQSSLILKQLSIADQSRRFVTVGARRAFEDRSSGESILLASVPVFNLPWSLIVQQPTATAYAPISAATWQAIRYLLLTVAGVAIVASGIGLQISRPLQSLVRSAQSLAEGDLTTRVNMAQRDEIGDLGRAFDSMAATLEQRTLDLEDVVVSLREEVHTREEAEQALKHAYDDLEERVAARTVELARSNAELEHFAYVASHDLQEPLRMISNYTQLLSRRYKGQFDSDADDFIAFAVEGAQRMQQLINDLLAYSRVGTKGREFEPVEMADVYDAALKNLATAMNETGAIVTHDELPSVSGDPVQLTQVLQNLIANAVKFRTEDVPRVHVGVEPGDEGWLFSVRDNGIGLDQQYADRIFVVFQRLHTRSEYAGTGIGLAICKRVVERHGGRIWVESQPGEGATFYFTMPVASAVTRPIVSEPEIRAAA